MWKSSAAKRARPAPGDALVVLLVLAGAALVLFLFRPSPGNFLTATIVLDSATVTTFDLTGAESGVLDVPGAPYPITLAIEDGQIRVLHSDCPSQDCVRVGWVDRSGGQLVCLPNRLVVSVRGTIPQEIDAVAG